MPGIDPAYDKQAYKNFLETRRQEIISTHRLILEAMEYAPNQLAAASLIRIGNLLLKAAMDLQAIAKMMEVK